MATKFSLNEKQKAAVTHGDGPLLIVAGAGTGKTTVITERIKHLILEKHVHPSEILALTFTEKAAREMEERVDVALPYGYTQLWISTFHAFCDRILRNEAIHIGLNPAFKLATEAEAILFLRKHLYELHLSYFHPLGNPHKFISGILDHFSRLKDDDITPAEYLAYVKKKAGQKKEDRNEIKKLQELSHAFKTYEDMKAKESVMDFSDLIANVLELFRTRKNVLSSYQQKFKYVMVDEFQDTNYAQNELAVLLAGDKQNITVVGDDDQAIYRWRGAALANIIQFREHFPKARVISLTKNYRSTREILNRSYQLIQHNNPYRLEVQEKINKQLSSMREVKGDDVELLFGQRVEHEADAVAEKIKTLTKSKKYDYKNIAILVRANDHAQPFVRAFERAQIPYQFLGPGQLFHQEEIKDLIAYLKILYNFEDNASMYRILTHPIFAIDARDVATLLNFARKRNFTLFEGIEQIDQSELSDSTKEKGRNIGKMIHRHLKQIQKDTAGQILYYYLEDSGLLKKFINPESAISEKRAKNIARFFEKLKSYEVEHDDASVFAVVDWIDLSMQLGESPMAADIDWTENDAVNILTVHSSKGLEFPVVFVVNLVTQRFPTRDRREQIPVPDDLIKEAFVQEDQNLSEERRLFYVAMTRARDHLYLTAANYYGEGKRERKLSPFVYEALGEPYVNAVLQKKKAEASVTQLSLHDILQESRLHEKQDDTSPLSASFLTPVTYLTYSHIQTFATCPLHYKLKYLLKIPPFPTSAFSYGSSVHAVLRDYYQQKMKGVKTNSKMLDALLKRHWIPEGYKSRSHEKGAYDQAKSLLYRYVKTHGKTIPLAVEVPFQFAIPGLKISGRIDRVDKLENGMIEIIDYKTGSTMPDEKKLLSDLQMSIYALAATTVRDELFQKNPQEVLLSLYYLDTDTKLTTTRTKEQLDTIREMLIQKAKEIAASDFSCSLKNCRNCEYQMLCQTFTN